MQKIGIFGSGSWAVALAKILCENSKKGEKINWYFRKKDDIDFFTKKHHHPRYLTTTYFNIDKLTLYSDSEAFLKDSDVIILAVPSAFLHEQLMELSRERIQNKIFFSAIKGIIPQYLLIIGEYLNHVFGVPYTQIGVITGPSHAEEVAMEKLSYLTIASENEEVRNFMARRLECGYVRTVPSDDIYGTEISAVLKNVYAIAGGMCMGLGYGDNFLAVLVSYAMQELKTFIHNVHPLSRDFLSSAYVGDLLVTVYSPFSRNRTFGMMIGKGLSVRQARMEMNMVAEGYYSAACIQKICSEKQLNPELALLVYSVLYEGANPSEEIKKLLPKLT